jgi:DNA invertase Pin-like site-specific DNA recombinase
MLTVGYARLSTFEQPAYLVAQQRDLRNAGAEKIFVDEGGPYDRRVMLDQALKFLREGDVFVCCRPDRLCRNMAGLLKIEADLAKRRIALIVLSIGGQVLDTRTPGARQQLAFLGGVVRWQAAVAREAQAVGIAAAKARGDAYKGRTASISPGLVREMARMGLRPTRIAQQLRIARSSVYRLLPPDYKVAPRPKRLPRERLNPAVIQGMLRSGMGPTAIGQALGCNRSSVYRLAGYADARWR